MKHSYLFLAIILLFGLRLNAQDSPSGECPRLEVIGPSRIMIPGEPATFVLQSEQDFPESFRYDWAVENGTVLSGQGTRAVEITSMMYGSTVRASATVKGLPAGCPNTASDTAGVMQHLDHEVLDEWGEMPNNDQRGRLDLFFAELSQYPHHKGLIVLYSKTRAVEKRRLNLYLDHARFRKFDLSRLVFCMMVVGQTNTKIYRLPPELRDEIEPGCKLIPANLLK